MVTNALSPMRVIEALQDIVYRTGMIGAMSSGQGSIANNSNAAGREVYRGSKAALNMFMRSYAARQSTRRDPRTYCSWRPAGSRRGLGGPNARLHHRGKRAEGGERSTRKEGKAWS